MTISSEKTLLVKAAPTDLTQIKSLVSTLDAPASTGPTTPTVTDSIRLAERPSADVARAISREIKGVRVATAGPSIILSGTQEDVTRAKTLAANLDIPSLDSKYTSVYRIRNVDATSLADLLGRSFHGVEVVVDKSLNAVSVTTTSSLQRRIAEAIAQLDNQNVVETAQGPSLQPNATPDLSAANVEVIQLQAAVPSQGQTGSTTALEVANAVSQALQQGAPDLKITVPANTQSLVLAGSPNSVRLAKQLIAKLDVSPALVVLDTEVLEVDESVARNVGLQLSQPAVSATFSEIVPAPDANGNPSRLMRPQPITRTPISISAQVNLLVQNGNARVLADPRITTLSGHTASIRAGDSFNILTTVGGGLGTYATTQLQTFQTGVTLDITPIVSSDGHVTVSLHPIVNSLTGILNGVPQIATRDTQTTVRLDDDQTLVIGGLIQESQTKNVQKIPGLGDLPLIGRVFRNDSVSGNRNELIIVVTPHIIQPGETNNTAGVALPKIPTPKPLPTLPPGLMLPKPAKSAASAPIVSLANAPAPTSSAAPATESPKAPVAVPAIPADSAGRVPTIYGERAIATAMGPTDPPRIFYARIAPLDADGRLSVEFQAGSNAQRAAASVGAANSDAERKDDGLWHAMLNLKPGMSGSAQINITVYRADGNSASISLPIQLN